MADSKIFLVFGGMNYYPEGDNDLISVHAGLDEAEEVAKEQLRGNKCEWSAVIGVYGLALHRIVRMWRYSPTSIRLCRNYHSSTEVVEIPLALEKGQEIF